MGSVEQFESTYNDPITMLIELFNNSCKQPIGISAEYSPAS